MPRPGAEQHAIWSLQEGQSARIDFIVTDAELTQFAALSGDHNPLHSDRQFARSRGFKDRVVYGALILAKLSQVIGMHLPGRDSFWHGVTIQFHKPLLVGRPATVEVVVEHLLPATRSVTLTIAVTSEGELLARGKAQVGILDAA